MANNETIRLSREVLDKVAGGWKLGYACPYCTAARDQILFVGRLSDGDYYECQECHVKLRNPGSN